MQYYYFVTAAVASVAVVQASQDSIPGCGSDAVIVNGEPLPDAVDACQPFLSPRDDNTADPTEVAESTTSDLVPIFTVGWPSPTVTSTSPITTTSEFNTTSTTTDTGGVSFTAVLPDPINTTAPTTTSGSTRVWRTLVGVIIPVSVALVMN